MLLQPQMKRTTNQEQASTLKWQVEMASVEMPLEQVSDSMLQGMNIVPIKDVVQYTSNSSLGMLT